MEEKDRFQLIVLEVKCQQKSKRRCTPERSISLVALGAINNEEIKMPQSNLKPVSISPNVDLRQLRKAVSEGYTASSSTVLDLIDFAIRQLSGDTVQTDDGSSVQVPMKQKLSDFEHGVFFAVAQIQNMAGEPVLAADILKGSGFQNHDCSELDDMDKEGLRVVNQERDMFLQGLD